MSHFTWKEIGIILVGILLVIALLNLGIQLIISSMDITGLRALISLLSMLVIALLIWIITHLGKEYARGVEQGVKLKGKDKGQQLAVTVAGPNPATPPVPTPMSRGAAFDSIIAGAPVRDAPPTMFPSLLLRDRPDLERKPAEQVSPSQPPAPAWSVPSFEVLSNQGDEITLA